MCVWALGGGIRPAYTLCYGAEEDGRGDYVVGGVGVNGREGGEGVVILCWLLVEEKKYREVFDNIGLPPIWAES